MGNGAILRRGIRKQMVPWARPDDVNIKAIICEIEITPNATGRLWTVQNVDRIEEKLINGSY